MRWIQKATFKVQPGRMRVETSEYARISPVPPRIAIPQNTAQ